MPSRKKPLIGGLLGLVSFFLTGLVFGFGYLFMMGTVLGKRGIENVGAIVTLPALGLFMGMAWLAVDYWLSRRGKAISTGRAALYGAGIGLLLGLVIAGFRGFTMAGGSTLFNYFTMGVGAVGAGLHRLLVSRAIR